MYVPFYHAIRDFFRQAKWTGQPVPVVFAGPDRAHEEMRRVIRKRAQGQAGVSQSDQAQTDRAVPVPFMSLWISPPKFWQDHYSPARYVTSKDLQKGTATTARSPHPVEAEVQVDLWCGTAGGDLIAMSLEPQIEMRFFGGHIALPINWSDPRWFKPPFNVSEHVRHYGQSGIRLYTNGWEDSSDLEAGDGPDETRRTWSGRLQGYVPFPAQEARIVRTIPIGIQDADTLETYDTVTSGVED